MRNNSDKICDVCGGRIKKNDPKWRLELKRTYKSRFMGSSEFFKLYEKIFPKGEIIYPACRNCASSMLDNAIAENIGGKAYGDYIGDGMANGHGERKLGHCLSI